MAFAVACEGPKGQAGPQGPVGSAGETGQQGEEGVQGPAGRDGSQGETGERGRTGLAGPQGPRGETGQRGATGSQGARGPVGAAGVSDAGFVDFISDKREAVVAIFGEDVRGNSNFIGSGVRISATEVLTAAHVVSGKSYVNPSVRGEGLVFGTVAGYDVARDVALVTFSGKIGGETIPLPSTPAWQDHAIGTEIAIIGFVEDASLTTPMMCFGKISVVWTVVPGDYTQVNADTCAVPGMSGSPVLNSRGDFIGVVLGTSASSWTRFLGIGEIVEVIDALREGVKH